MIVDTPTICDAWDRATELVALTLVLLLRRSQLIKLVVAVTLNDTVNILNCNCMILVVFFEVRVKVTKPTDSTRSVLTLFASDQRLLSRHHDIWYRGLSKLRLLHVDLQVIPFKESVPRWLGLCYLMHRWRFVFFVKNVFDFTLTLPKLRVGPLIGKEI